MAKFYVGQRVRVARSNDPMTDRYLGMEGVIIEIDDENWVDGSVNYGLDICPITQVDGDTYLCWDDTELEPLFPPHESC